MPLSMASVGQQARIEKITGKDEVRLHLKNLGFVPGAPVTVVSQLGGNLILSVMDARIALGRGMASRILVSII